MLDDLVLMSSGDAGPESAEFRRASAIAERVLGHLHTIDLGAVQTRMLSDGTLLVVDDSPMNCDLISRQLARFGFTVTTAGSGREALHILRERDFDLVLLDILMPEMDGVEVLHLLRTEVRHQDLPVIVMSSLDDVSSLVRCLEFGADDYLVKPVDATLLSVRVGALLQLKRARQREQLLIDALERERTFSNGMLGGMLPEGVLARFRSGESPILDTCQETTVLAVVLEGFSRMATRQGSNAAVIRAQLLAAFDDCAQRHRIDVAIATGDMYIAAAGVPLPEPDHALRVAAFALELQSIAETLLPDGDETTRPRMGLHCGPLFAGTVRTRHPSYDVWGEARETARAVALHAAPGTIHVSPAAFARLQPLHKLQARGVVDVPGHGQMRTYRLLGTQVEQTA
jgi:CheY-like chemotaxis protein